MSRLFHPTRNGQDKRWMKCGPGTEMGPWIRLYLEFFEAIGNLYIYQQTRYVTKMN